MTTKSNVKITRPEGSFRLRQGDYVIVKYDDKYVCDQVVVLDPPSHTDCVQLRKHAWFGRDGVFNVGHNVWIERPATKHEIETLYHQSTSY